MQTENENIKKLAIEVVKAEKEHQNACYNGTIMMQVGASERLTIWRQAFAIATGTAVNGLEFKKLLDEVRS